MDPRHRDVASSEKTALLRGMTQRRLGRRDLFRAGGLSMAALALGACTSESPAKAPTGPMTVSQFWGGKSGHGVLDWANWPYYMDTEKKPELTAFTAETGIQVTYEEVIGDMPSWFDKLQPVLASGQPIGYDLMVLSYGIEFGHFVKANFLAPLDHSRLPNFASNVNPEYKRTKYDPGNVYSVPWAVGMTGIAYNPELTGRPITRWSDLWDPAFAGRVGLPSDPQELSNIALLALGIDPATSTPKEWEAAANLLQQKKEAGIIHKFYDQSYIDALASGEVWLTWAWSGDVLQRNIADGTDLQFLIPEEGGTIWIDNFAIPVTARNPVDALAAIDFFYRTDISASLMEYLGYVAPVPGVKEVIAQHAAAAPTDEERAYLEAILSSPFVFPDEATYAKLHYYVEPKSHSLEQQYLSIFEPVVHA